MLAVSLLEAPVLARVIRQGFLESVHRGVAVITAPDGTVERAWWALDGKSVLGDILA